MLHQPALQLVHFKNAWRFALALSQEGQQVKKPHWQPVKGARKCNAATEISDPATIKITWDSSSQDAGMSEALNSTSAPLKWQAARN